MRITKLELRQIAAELPGAFSAGTYHVANRTALLCRVATDQGVVGEVCVGNEFGYSDFLKSLIRGPFRELLIGRDPLTIERHWASMLSHATGYVDRESVMKAVATVDIALWDLKGRITGQPLWRLIGGFNPRVPMIGIGGYYETSRDEAGIREEIAFYRKSGLAGIKFKVGALSIEEDADRVRIARDAAGPGFALVVDSNMAWTPRDAVRFAEMIRPYAPEWLEEPVHWRNINRGLSEVRMKAGIRTAAGQSAVSAFDCWDLLASGAVDVVNVTCNRGGGITAWTKIAGAAALVDVRMAQVAEPHISMHLMAGISNGTFVECYPDRDRDPFWAELYRDRPPVVDGHIVVPDAPGIGLSFDDAAVERYAIEPWH